MELRRASEFSVADLTRFWNLGYTGYFAPIQFTEELMANWIRWGDFDLGRSLILMDGAAPVGFSFLGVRGRRGWIGGFGVAPDYRGRGIAGSLFADHVAQFAGWGMEHVQLEVLVQNWAWKVYERAGFAITRRLSVLKGTLPAAGTPVAEADPAALLGAAESLHAGQPACWQRERPYLEKSLPPTAVGLYVGSADTPDAVAIANSNGTAVRIVEAAAADSAAASALAGALAARFPGQTVTLVNEPAGSAVHQALTAIGCEEAMAQHEMHWEKPHA